MNLQNRILGKVVGQQFTPEELEMISGGWFPDCNGCVRAGQVSTGIISHGLPGCMCDNVG